MSEKVECEICLRQELIPEVGGEGFADASQNGEEVGFEGLDGTFCKVASMNVSSHKLVGSFSIFRDDTNVLCASFISSTWGPTVWPHALRRVIRRV